MGSIRLGVHEQITLEIKNLMGAEIFVETGTYKGGTAMWASANFDRVITIEAYEPRYRKTIAGLGQKSNVTWVLGDSRVMLPRHIITLDEPIIFWLDAHWCGNSDHSVNMGNECPLMDELEAITKHRRFGEHAILIDDARLFLSPPPMPHDPEQWPPYQIIRDFLTEHGYECVVFEDVIYCVPKTKMTALLLLGMGQ